MVSGWREHPINAPINYPLVTHWLYIPRALGLNKKAADKTLTDSVLSVFLFAFSNKTAPKDIEKAPEIGGGSK